MEQLAGEKLLIRWRNGLKEEIKLPDEQVTSVYRIVQESLFNVLKHSQADQVVVTARKDDACLELTIEDDGIGISNDGKGQAGLHYGFLNMKERATMIGADLNIASEPGKGTTALKWKQKIFQTHRQTMKRNRMNDLNIRNFKYMDVDDFIRISKLSFAGEWTAEGLTPEDFERETRRIFQWKMIPYRLLTALIGIKWEGFVAEKDGKVVGGGMSLVAINGCLPG
jgi:hypothetical protein